ncbi:hypothetical protein EG328_008959 [Venturia inaequalis]|uniref:Uncharacterized protein n=1 Tax=Venturia inaequalis TaxID=5025 RepID=A0A8H3VAT5_VENIN|nr:hypothetical protein EG328_008959 [Venturia inaequalis]
MESGDPPKAGGSRQPTGSLPPSTTTISTPALASSSQTIRSQSAPKRRPSSEEPISKAMATHKSFDSTKPSTRGSRDNLIAKAPTRKPSQEASSSSSPPPPNPNPNDQAYMLRSTLRALHHLLRSHVLLYCKMDANYLIALAKVREMTHSIIRKTELLPPDETLEQHAKWQKEHADSIQQDKDNPDKRNGGLWKGFFRRPTRLPRPALRDVEDGVDRCPYCQWELEDGMCQRCGLPFDENGTGMWEYSDGLSEQSGHGMRSEQGSELDVDLEIDMDDDIEIDEFDDEEQAERDAVLDNFYHENGPMAPIPEALQRFLENGHDYGVRRPAAHSAAHSRRRSYSASIASDVPSEMHTLEELDEEEEEDDDSSMNEFIESDDRPLSISGSASSSTYASSRASMEPAIIIEEDEEEEDEDATEDEGPVPNGRRRRIVTESSSPVAQSRSRVRTVSETTDDSQPVITSRNRRVISETPPSESTATAAETEGEEEEDELPVPAGRRRRRDTAGDETRRVRPRQRESSVESSAASNATSMDTGDPDNWVYERLRGQQPHDEGEDLQWGDESDGGRTTVGWEPITNSIERNRNTGSLTPLADRPNAPRRPLSRTGPSRYPQVPRALRRRGSTVSANDHYEDNDADDDVSETDQEGDTNMNRPRLRQQNSRVRLRHSISRPLLSRAQPVLANQDNESDDTDLSSQSPQHEQLIRQREYNPVFGQLFAQHQNDLQVEDIDSRPPFAEFEHLRTLARTPLARPRTGNRNRITGYSIMPSPGPLSRATPPAHNTPRYRSPLENSFNVSALSNVRPVVERSNSASSRTSHHSNTMSSSDASSRIIGPRSDSATAGPPSPTNTARSRTVSQIMFPLQSARVGDLIERPASRLPGARPGDQIDRPASRVNSRPPSASGRRGSAGRTPFSAPPPLSPMAPGLNTARIWQHNNPFFNARAAGLRTRQSSQRLREQPSNATLRARDSNRTLRQQPSVINVRDVPDQSHVRARGSNRTLRQQPSQINFREEADQSSPQVRPQASRLHLRPQPSYRRLQQTQIQGQLMREATLAQLLDPNQPEFAMGQRYSPNTVPTLSEDERRRRANELVRRRALELAEERINEQRTNPFQRRPRQAQSAANQSEAPTDAPATAPTSNRAPAVINATSSNQYVPGQQPTLGRRRSSRGLAPIPQSGFTPASVLHSANTGTIRARLGALPGRAGGYESHVPTGMARGIAALTAGGEFRHN